MITVLIIYYKQISEGYEDKERFAIMEKVGMSNAEVKALDPFPGAHGIFPAARHGSMSSCSSISDAKKTACTGGFV